MGLFDSMGKFLQRGGNVVSSIIHGVASDGEVYPPKVDTGGRTIVRGEFTTMVSASFFAAGSATLLAASAGTRRTFSDFLFLPLGTIGSVKVVHGSKSLIVRTKLIANQPFLLSANTFLQTSANVAVKVSAIGAGSAFVQAHYIANPSL